MPSSSARNTRLELQLIRLWRQVYYRLYYANEEKTNEILRLAFAAVLDISDTDLVERYFSVRHEPTLQTVEEWEREVEGWKEWADKLQKMKRNVLLEGVVECVHNAGTALDLAGMHQAGGEWRSMSETIRMHYDL